MKGGTELAKEKRGVEKCLSKWEQHAEGSQARESRTGGREEGIQCDGAWGSRRRWWVVGCSSGEEHGRSPEGSGEPRCVLGRQRLVQVAVGESGDRPESPGSAQGDPGTVIHGQIPPSLLQPP